MLPTGWRFPERTIAIRFNPLISFYKAIYMRVKFWERWHQSTSLSWSPAWHLREYRSASSRSLYLLFLLVSLIHFFTRSGGFFFSISSEGNVVLNAREGLRLKKGAHVHLYARRRYDLREVSSMTWTGPPRDRSTRVSGSQLSTIRVRRIQGG